MTTTSKSRKEEYSITILPQGQGKPEVKLIFDSMEQKTKYVQKESSYCRREENDYLCSVPPERETKKNIFLKKRAEFAKKIGFAPLRGNKTVWKIVTKDVPPSPPKVVA